MPLCFSAIFTKGNNSCELFLCLSGHLPNGSLPFQARICSDESKGFLFRDLLLTLKAPITSTADDYHKYFLTVFQRKYPKVLKYWDT